MRTITLDPQLSALEIPESYQITTPSAVIVRITLDLEAVPLSDRNRREFAVRAVVDHKRDEVLGEMLVLGGSLRDPFHATVNEGSKSDIMFTLIGKTSIIAKTRLIAIRSKSDGLQQFKARLPREVLVLQHGLGASGKLRFTGLRAKPSGRRFLSFWVVVPDSSWGSDILAP